MIKAGVYVDDSGNPGAESGSEFLTETRKSWTAVIVPSCIEDKVAIAMEILLSGVKQDFDADELHFTDIYSGRGAWRSVSIQKRIEVFDLMQLVLDNFQLPIVHQSASQETFEDHEASFANIEKADDAWWDIKDVAHFGFLMLCSRLARELRQFHKECPAEFDLPFPLFVDEGLAKAGAEVDLPNWGDVIEGAKARFRPSHEEPGIQIADFAAFAISRTQWIMAQQELGSPISRGDMKFLQSTSNLNVLNLPKVAIDPKNVSREAYEFGLMRDRMDKGLSPRPKKS